MHIEKYTKLKTW